MARFFHELAAFVIGLFRAIIWFVLLVALLLVAYCAVREMEKAFTHVNRHWFDGDDTYRLIAAAGLLMAIGCVVQIVRRFRRRNPPDPRDQRWPLMGPPGDGRR